MENEKIAVEQNGLYITVDVDAEIQKYADEHGQLAGLMVRHTIAVDNLFNMGLQGSLSLVRIGATKREFGEKVGSIMADAATTIAYLFSAAVTNLTDEEKIAAVAFATNLVDGIRKSEAARALAVVEATNKVLDDAMREDDDQNGDGTRH